MSSLLYVKLKKEINLKQRGWRIVQPSNSKMVLFNYFLAAMPDFNKFSISAFTSFQNHYRNSFTLIVKLNV